jgi:hypothetical protein
MEGKTMNGNGYENAPAEIGSHCRAKAFAESVEIGLGQRDCIEISGGIIPEKMMNVAVQQELLSRGIVVDSLLSGDLAIRRLGRHVARTVRAVEAVLKSSDRVEIDMNDAALAEIIEDLHKARVRLDLSRKGIVVDFPQMSARSTTMVIRRISVRADCPTCGAEILVSVDCSRLVCGCGQEIHIKWED